MGQYQQGGNVKEALNGAKFSRRGTALNRAVLPFTLLTDNLDERSTNTQVRTNGNYLRRSVRQKKQLDKKAIGSEACKSACRREKEGAHERQDEVQHRRQQARRGDWSVGELKDERENVKLSIKCAVRFHERGGAQ